MVPGFIKCSTTTKKTMCGLLVWYHCARLHINHFSPQLSRVMIFCLNQHQRHTNKTIAQSKHRGHTLLTSELCPRKTLFAYLVLSKMTHPFWAASQEYNSKCCVVLRTTPLILDQYCWKATSKTAFRDYPDGQSHTVHCNHDKAIIQKLGIDDLPHLAQFPDFSPLEYHLFRSLEICDTEILIWCFLHYETINWS